MSSIPNKMKELLYLIFSAIVQQALATLTDKQIESYLNSCGKVYQSPSIRIIGGTESKPDSWPAVAFLLMSAHSKKPDQTGLGRSFCTGVLISTDTILTAGHCILTDDDPDDFKLDQDYPTYESMYTIYLGAFSLESIETNLLYDNYYQDDDLSYKPVRVKAKKLIRHPNFTFEDNHHLKNDLGIIKLAENVSLSQHVQLACLPFKRSYDYPSSTSGMRDPGAVYAVGWGNTVTDSVFPTPSINQMNVKLRIYDFKLCVEGNVTYESSNERTQLCVGDIINNFDTCQGDSGGAIYMLDMVNNNPKLIAVGLVSYGKDCATDVPAIYTRISYFIDWIAEQM